MPIAGERRGRARTAESAHRRLDVEPGIREAFGALVNGSSEGLGAFDAEFIERLACKQSACCL